MFTSPECLPHFRVLKIGSPIRTLNNPFRGYDNHFNISQIIQRPTESWGKNWKICVSFCTSVDDVSIHLALLGYMKPS